MHGKNIIMIIFGATLIFEGIMGFVFVFILHKVIRLNFGKKEKSADEESAEDAETEEEMKVETKKVLVICILFEQISKISFAFKGI